MLEKCKKSNLPSNKINIRNKIQKSSHIELLFLCVWHPHTCAHRVCYYVQSVCAWEKITSPKAAAAFEPKTWQASAAAVLIRMHVVYTYTYESYAPDPRCEKVQYKKRTTCAGVGEEVKKESTYRLQMMIWWRLFCHSCVPSFVRYPVPLVTFYMNKKQFKLWHHIIMLYCTAHKVLSSGSHLHSDRIQRRTRLYYVNAPYDDRTPLVVPLVRMHRMRLYRYRYTYVSSKNFKKRAL